MPFFFCSDCAYLLAVISFLFYCKFEVQLDFILGLFPLKLPISFVNQGQIDYQINTSYKLVIYW